MSVIGAFALWFDSLPLEQKRAVLRERLVAYLGDPMAGRFIDALPPDVRDQAIALRDLVRTADWSVKN